MSIDEQKKIADKVLSMIETIDPTAIIAGGAPRDWTLGFPATDLDVYYHFRDDIQEWMHIEALDNVGFPPRKTVGGDNHGLYEYNPDIRHVDECIIDGMTVQLIRMAKPTFGIVETFPFSICQFFYKRGKIHASKSAQLSVKHKKVARMNKLYVDSNRYIQKIINKFTPLGYKFYPDAQSMLLSIIDEAKE